MTGPEHDKFCEYHGETMYGTRPCTCDYLAKVRDDEREKTVKLLEALAEAMMSMQPVEEEEDSEQ